MTRAVKIPTWICNAFGDGSDLTAVTGPTLPAVTGLTSVFGGLDFHGSATESLTWGGVTSGAQIQLQYTFNNNGLWTQVLTGGTEWNQGDVKISTPYPEEGASYTYRIRQIYHSATVPIPSYSDDWSQIDMPVYPFAPTAISASPTSPTSAQLL